MNLHSGSGGRDERSARGGNETTVRGNIPLGAPLHLPSHHLSFPKQSIKLFVASPPPRIAYKFAISSTSNFANSRTSPLRQPLPKGDAMCPATNHTERHFTAGEIVRDIVIGMSDGLTVPFALAAGLSGASAPSSIVVTAGLAEVAAGSIAMGLGGYLAARSDVDHYENERKREEDEVARVPDTEADEVAEILANFGLEPNEYWPVVEALRKRPEAWIDFMMRFELGLEKPDPARALQSALTIAASYIVGGLIPLLPYIIIPEAMKALRVSIVVTLIALFIFGYVKGRFTGLRPFWSAFQTVCIGALASAAAFAIASAINA